MTLRGRYRQVGSCSASFFSESLTMEESSETMICAKCGLPITDELFIAVEREDGRYKWIEWEHLYDCADSDTLRFWLNHSI